MLQFLCIILFIFVYFLPTYIAIRSNKKNMNAIIILNVLLGWTGLVWIACLVWATLKD